MREIKFRALSKHDLKYIEKGQRGFMFYQQVIEDKDGVPELWFINEKDPDFRYRFEAVFLDDDWYKMQYTGLEDKNGKEIWEGDILKIVANYNNGAIGFVVWDEDYPQFSVELIQGDKRAFHSETGANWFPEIVEVIGNIHENPELLK